MPESTKAADERRPRPDPPGHFTLTFVIGGEPTTVRTNPHHPLRKAASEALEASGNTGRPLDDYQARDKAGNQLGFDTRIQDLGLEDGATVFLSTDVGQGGCSAS